MKRTAQLTRTIEKRYLGRQWYHQRFDGTPLFLFMVGEGEMMRETRKPVGTEAEVRICFFNGPHADWYLDMHDVERGAQKIIAMAKRSRSVSTRLLRAWRRDEQKFERYFWEAFPTLELRELSDTELIGVWRTVRQYFTDRISSSSIIDHFALGSDRIIYDMLRREIGTVKRESAFVDIFATATAPVHQSFINEAEIEFLRMLLGSSRYTMETYAARYYWSMNNCSAAKKLSAAHFEREAKTWRKSKKEIRKVLRDIQQTPVRNARRKRTLFKRHRFTPLLRALLKISEDFTMWQDERKKSTYLNIHMGNAVLREIARRTSYTSQELKYALPLEIEHVFKRTTVSRGELRARKKRCAIVVTREGYWVGTGRAASSYRKRLLSTQQTSAHDDIRGLSASMGRVIGTVRVVRSANEIRKVREGDIIVAVMTRPDYIPAMRRAAAIVTNEGGITSHAAIVSRELGIPCIIGTKTATEMFRDGDRVEVNANHGWVRKIL